MRINQKNERWRVVFFDGIFDGTRWISVYGKKYLTFLGEIPE